VSRWSKGNIDILLAIGNAGFWRQRAQQIFEATIIDN